MIRANLIKSFRQRRDGGGDHASPRVSRATRGARGETTSLEMKHGGRRNEGPGVYVRGSFALCPVGRWLNFARIPPTKIAIRAGATSEFFMPTSRGQGKEASLQPCIFYAHSIFAFPSLPLLPPSTFSSTLVPHHSYPPPPSIFRLPVLLPPSSSASHPFRIHFRGAAAIVAFLLFTKLGHRRQRKFNLERTTGGKRWGTGARPLGDAEIKL